MLASFLPRVLVRDLVVPSGHPGSIRAEPLQVAAMFADLSGFSALSEALAKLGPGADERVTEILNSCFAPSIREVYAHGGDVLNFAGDALLAVWTVAEGRTLADCTALATSAALLATAEVDKLDAVEGHRLQLRVGVAAGAGSRLDVGGVDERWHHLITGAAISQLAVAGQLAKRGDVVLSPEAWNLIEQTAFGEPVSSGHMKVTRVDAPPLPPEMEMPEIDSVAESRIRAYAPEAVLGSLASGVTAWVAELRPVTTLFISLRQLDLDDPRTRSVTQEGISTVQTVLRRFGGGVHKITMDEKGVLIVGVFGLPPYSHENNAARGARAAVELHGALRDLHLVHGIGVTSGRAWCGVIGNDARRDFTVIAPVVNQAARFMQHAVNDVYCDDATVQGARGWVRFQPMAQVIAKGMSAPLNAHRPLWGESPDVRERTSPGGAGKATMVGREAERRILIQGLDGLLKARKSSVTLVQGEPGIGKSALLGDLMARAEGKAVEVLSGAGDSMDANTPYHAWIGVFHRFFETSPVLPPRVRSERVLGRLLTLGVPLAFAPLLNPVLNIGLAENDHTRDLAGPVRHARTVDFLVQVLAAAGGEHPVLVVLDDVQWLDSASWELLDQVQRRVSPLLLVVGTRPIEEPAPLEFRRLRDGDATLFVELGTLPSNAIVDLVRKRLGVRELPPEIAAVILPRADGNPFFSEQLAYVLRDSGSITVTDGVCIVASEMLPTLRFPDTVHGLVTSRLDRLPAEEQPTVKVASVIGRSFGLDVLAGVLPSGIDAPTLDVHLQNLNRLRIASRESEVAWSFKHAITREAAYELLPFQQRQRVHLAVATWYEERVTTLGTAVLPVLAWHFRAGGDSRKALDWLERAGESALQQGASREAIHFFAQARELDDSATPALRAFVPDRRRAAWASRLGEARMGLGDLAGAGEALTAALTRLGESVPVSAFARGVRLLREVARQAMHQLRPVSQVRIEAVAEVARAWALIGEICYFRTDIGGWALASLVAINRAEQAGDVTIASRAYIGLANLAGTLRMPKLMARYLERARRTGDPSARMAADWAEGVYRLTFEEWDTAFRVIRNGVQLGEQSGAHYELGIGITILGYLQYCVCPTSEALTTFRAGLASARARGNLQHESWALTLMVPLLLARNEVDEALQCVEAAGRRLGTSDPLSVPIFHGVRARTLWRLGRHAEALAAADHAVAAFKAAPPAGYIYMPGIAGLMDVAIGEITREGGDTARGRALAAAGMGVFQGFAMLFPFARARRALYRGLLAEAEGKGSAAFFADALRRAEGAKLRWEEGAAHFGLARHTTGEAALAHRRSAEAALGLMEERSLFGGA